MTQKPTRFEPGELHFWDDPYIAQQMLAAHLNPDIDTASRKPSAIENSVQWIIKHLHLQPGESLLDLGCGPGLYCQRFTEYGLKVTGVDLSENSLHYARKHDLITTYIHQNYLQLQLDQSFEVVTMIYGDFCVLPDADRDFLLQKIRGWTKKYFVFDVSTRQRLVLFSTFDYPEDDTTLEQYIVIEEDGSLSTYRNWFHDYSPETITTVLEKAGFQVTGVFSDLMGTSYQPDSEWLGVVASPHR